MHLPNPPNPFSRCRVTTTCRWRDSMFGAIHPTAGPAGVPTDTLSAETLIKDGTSMYVPCKRRGERRYK